MEAEAAAWRAFLAEFDGMAGQFDACVLQVQLQRSQQGPAATVDQMRTLNEPRPRLP